MSDLFKNHQKKQALRDKIYFYTFYTVLLYLLALIIILISKKNQVCLFDFYCVSSKSHNWQAAFILYIYLLILVVIIIQTYKGLEKLIAHKDHIQYFKYIFYSIPFLVAFIVWLVDTKTNDAYLIIVFSAIISIIGLLMIEFRKKK
jgi:hypothetical protein